jgi:hypothetical protein
MERMATDWGLDLKLAVISGGDWLLFEIQLLSHLPQDDRLLNLFLLPLSVTPLCRRLFDC